MHIPGHLAVAWAFGRHARLPRMAPALLGALLPDLIDKPILYLGGSLYGRTLGHSMLSFALLCAVGALAAKRARGTYPWIHGLAVGVASHLLLDLVEGAVMGALLGRSMLTSWWLWPYFVPDDLWLPPYAPLYPAPSLIWSAEAVVVLAMIAHNCSRPRRAHKIEGAN